MKPKIYRYNGDWACEDDESPAVGLGDTPSDAYDDYLRDGGGQFDLVAAQAKRMYEAFHRPTVLERLRKLFA